VYVLIVVYMLTFQWPPFVYQKSDRYSGLCMQLLDELSKNLNFRFVYAKRSQLMLWFYVAKET